MELDMRLFGIALGLAVDFAVPVNALSGRRFL